MSNVAGSVSINPFLFPKSPSRSAMAEAHDQLSTPRALICSLFSTFSISVLFPRLPRAFPLLSDKSLGMICRTESSCPRPAK